MASALASWKPNAGPQTAFLAQDCYEALYGGAVGGGKTISLLLAATRFVRHMSYRAILFRRTGPELEKTFVDVAAPIYRGLGATSRGSGRVWTFPSGARITFASMEHAADRFSYGSTAYQFVGFDELTTFEQVQYEFMGSRLRSVDPAVPCFLRAGTNPIGEGEGWVRKRFCWWVYPPGERTEEFAGPYARPGQVLHVVRDADGSERVVRRGTPGSAGRTFVPAKLEDNPVLFATDYADRLLLLDPVTRAKLREGDWMMRATPGKFFRREWFRTIGEIGEPVIARCRFWDRAATEPRDGAEPDWTVGCRVALTFSGRLVVEDVVHEQLEPADVESLICETAEEDQNASPKTTQVLEQEPGASGKFEVSHYIRKLAGIHVVAVAPTGSKPVRARPVAAQAAPPASNLVLIGAPWNASFVDEHVAFPAAGVHDDQVDGLSGAVAYLGPFARSAATSGGRKQGKRRPLAVGGTGGY